MRIVVDVLCKREADESWHASPSTALLQEIHARDSNGEGTARWIACIGDRVKIAVGDPIRGTSPWRKELYLPPWLLGDEDTNVSVRFEKSSAYPPAEHLNLKVLGSIPDGLDLREMLEEPLSQLGILEEGQVIPCPLLNASLLVQVCQPAGPVFLHGNEISLEVEHEEERKEKKEELKPAVNQDDFASILPPAMMTTPSSFQPFRGTGYSLK